MNDQNLLSIEKMEQNIGTTYRSREKKIGTYMYED